MASFCYLDVKTAHCRDMVYKANRRWGLLVWPYKVVHIILFALVSVDYNLIMCKTCLLCRRKKLTDSSSLDFLILCKWHISDI